MIDRPQPSPGDARWLACVVGPAHPALAPRDEIVVGILPGEGIGPAVTDAATRVLHAVAATHDLAVRVVSGPPVTGGPARTAGGLSADVARFFADVFAAGGAVLAGAVGGRFVYDLRRELDLFCKLVPIRPWPALAAAAPAGAAARDVDVLLVRENVAGLYQGRSRVRGRGATRRVEHTFAYTAYDVTRVVRVAAALAAQRRGGLTVVVKDGGVPGVSALWRECALAASEPLGIRPAFADIDLCAYQLVQSPARFDVVVAPNLFGDVLADVSAVLVGGRGLSYSGNFAASGAAVYQTNHGAAFDLAETDAANPVGQISALAMLLRESAGAGVAAAAIDAAIDAVFGAGWRTRDLARPGERVIGLRETTDRIVAAVHAGAAPARGRVAG